MLTPSQRPTVGLEDQPPDASEQGNGFVSDQAPAALPASDETVQSEPGHKRVSDAKKHPRDMREDERRDAMSALARKRWEKARAAESCGGSDPERTNPENARHAELAGWPAERDEIIAALRRKAEAGDVAAAREYRAWLETFGQGHDEGMSVEELGQLDPHLRARMAEALTQWLEAQEHTAGDPKAATTKAS
jgi:hypothetical protein